jgi:hypothetical protein
VSAFVESFAYFHLYFSTITWCVVAFFASMDAYREHRDTLEAARIARFYGNGRTIIAEGRLRIARWFLVGFVGVLIVGPLAFASLLWFPDPRPDTTLYTFILRYLLVFIIFTFGMAKRGNRSIRRKLDDLDSVDEKVDRLRALEEDTHKKSRR